MYKAFQFNINMCANYKLYIHFKCQYVDVINTQVEKNKLYFMYTIITKSILNKIHPNNPNKLITGFKSNAFIAFLMVVWADKHNLVMR